MPASAAICWGMAVAATKSTIAPMMDAGLAFRDRPMLPTRPRHDRADQSGRRASSVLGLSNRPCDPLRCWGGHAAAGFSRCRWRRGGMAARGARAAAGDAGDWLSERRIGSVRARAPNAEAVRMDVTAAGSVIGVSIEVVHASDSNGIEAAFATLAETKIGALVVATDPFYFSRRLQLAALALRYAIPTIYNTRQFVEVSGLMSYGTSLAETFRQLGNYTGRILRGEKPADLPAVQSTKFEFVINLKTAKALGLTVPPTLLARADEVIE